MLDIRPVVVLDIRPVLDIHPVVVLDIHPVVVLDIRPVVVLDTWELGAAAVDTVGRKPGNSHLLSFVGRDNSDSVHRNWAEPRLLPPPDNWVGQMRIRRWEAELRRREAMF